MPTQRVLPLLSKKITFLYFTNIGKNIDSVRFDSWQKRYSCQNDWEGTQLSESVVLSLNAGLNVSTAFYQDFLPIHADAVDTSILPAQLAKPVHADFVEITDRGKHLKEKMCGDEQTVEKYSYSSKLSDSCPLRPTIQAIEEKILRVPGYGQGSFRFDEIGLVEKPRTFVINLHVKFSFILEGATDPRESTFNHTDTFPTIQLAIDIHLTRSTPSATASIISNTHDLIDKINTVLLFTERHISPHAALLEVTPGITKEMSSLGYQLNRNIKFQQDFIGSVYEQDGQLFFSPRKARQRVVAEEITDLVLYPDQTRIKSELLQEAQRSGSVQTVSKYTLCNFFARSRGGCRSGDKCAYLHDKEKIGVVSELSSGWRIKK